MEASRRIVAFCPSSWVSSWATTSFPRCGASTACSPARSSIWSFRTEEPSPQPLSQSWERGYFGFQRSELLRYAAHGSVSFGHALTPALSHAVGEGEFAFVSDRTLGGTPAAKEFT